MKKEKHEKRKKEKHEKRGFPSFSFTSLYVTNNYSTINNT